MSTNLVLWIMFLASGIMVSEMIQSKDTALQIIGQGIALLFLISSVAFYLRFRRREDKMRNMKRFKQHGALLFGNAITLFTIGLAIYVTEITFGLTLLITAIFLGYEGYRTKAGHKFFIPVKQR